jgi:hypothetical protein
MQIEFDSKRKDEQAINLLLLETIRRWEKDLNIFLGAHMASKKAADAHWAACRESRCSRSQTSISTSYQQQKAMSTFQMMMSSQILLPSMILMGRRCCKNPQI